MQNEATSLDAWNEVETAALPPIDIDQMDKVVADFAALREQKDELEESLKTINAKIEQYKAQIIPVLQRYKKDNWEIKGLGKVGLSRSMLCSVPKDLANKSKLFAYLATFGKDTLLTMQSINHNTLTSFYKVEAEKAAKNNEVYDMPGVDKPHELVNLKFYPTKGKK